MIEERFGRYVLKIDYRGDDFAQVTVNDIAAKWPLIWSAPMTYKQANAALSLFKKVGFFNYID